MGKNNSFISFSFSIKVWTGRPTKSVGICLCINCIVTESRIFILNFIRNGQKYNFRICYQDSNLIPKILWKLTFWVWKQNQLCNKSLGFKMSFYNLRFLFIPETNTYKSNVNYATLTLHLTIFDSLLEINVFNFTLGSCFKMYSFYFISNKQIRSLAKVTYINL